MAKDHVGVRRPPPRHEDDPVDSFFEVPAAVLCATCGQADCPGCTAATESESGVLAIVPWERRGAMWTRLWSTSKATTQGAEAFFSVIPDGEISPAMSFAVIAELLAVASMAGLFALLLAAVAFTSPGLTVAVISDPVLRGTALRVVGLGIPGLAVWMILAHVTHGVALDVGARRMGAAPQRRRAVRFGLYACGWDLMTSPLGVVATIVTQGLGAALQLGKLVVSVPGRASSALLQGIYQLTPPDAAGARRAATLTRWALVALSAVLALVGFVALVG